MKAQYGCIKNRAEFTSYGGIIPVNGYVTWILDETKLSDSLSLEDALKGTRDSFDILQPYMGNVQFKEVTTNEEAQIVIGFYKNEDLEDPFNTDTLAYAYLGSGKTAFDIVSDVFFNDEDFQWALSHDFENNKYGYIDVCVHEVLHSLGLGHLEEGLNGILAPYYDPGADIVLNQDTINGLASIYGGYEFPTEDEDPTPEDSEVITFLKGLYQFRGDKLLNDLIEKEVVYIANYIGVEASTKDFKRNTINKIKTLLE